MATNLTESDSFDGNVTVPTPGDARVSASVQTFAQQLANRTRYLNNRLPAQQRDVTLHGADPTGTTECLLAFTTAVLEMHSLGGGVVRVPYGAYRINGTINLPTDVSIEAPAGATLYQEHLTQHTIWIQPGGYIGTPQRIFGLNFEGASVARGGTSIFMPSGYTNPRSLLIENCSHNELATNINGNFVGVRGDIARTRIVNCRATARSSAGSRLITCDGSLDTAELTISGCTFIGATSYSQALLGLAVPIRLRILDSVFDLSMHSTGTAYCLDLAGTPDVRQVRGCTFLHNGSGAAIKASGLLVEQGCTFTSVIGNHYAISSPLAQGSALSLPPINLTASLPGPYTIPDGRGVVTISSSNGNGGLGPNIIMPAVMCPGQRLTLTVVNASGSDWTTGVTFTGLPSGNSGAIPQARGRTWTMVAVDPDFDGDTGWVIEHDPSTTWIIP